MKDHFKRVSLAVPTLLLAFTALAAVPAFANSSADSTLSAGTTTSTKNDSQKLTTTKVTTTNTSSSDVSSSVNKTEVRTASAVASDDSQTTELHSKGKTLVAELQKAHPSKLTDTQRQKVCEAHKQGLTNKFTVMSSNSLSYQGRIDDVFDKALAYQTSKSVTSTELTALIATANTAKTASATSVANLKALSPTLDCNNVSVVQDVATFKTAASQARTDLNAYKAAVKAVIQVLKTATTTSTPKTTSTPEKSN
jgi:hypothetical protein